MDMPKVLIGCNFELTMPTICSIGAQDYSENWIRGIKSPLMESRERSRICLPPRITNGVQLPKWIFMA